MSQETLYPTFFCTVHMPGSGHATQLYIFTVSFCIPVVITIGCLLWILYKSNGKIWRPAKDERQPRSKQTRAVVLLIASLSCAQTLLCLPHHVVSFLRPGIHSTETTRGDSLSYATVACYAYAYSAVKPLLYIFLNEDIRDGFVEAVPFGKGNDIRGFGRGRRLPTSPARYQSKVPSMTSSMRTIHGYPYIVEESGENRTVMNGFGRRWSL